MKTKTTVKTTTTPTPAQERAAKLEAAKLALSTPTKPIPDSGVLDIRSMLRKPTAAERSSATTALKKANAAAGASDPKRWTMPKGDAKPLGTPAKPYAATYDDSKAVRKSGNARIDAARVVAAATAKRADAKHIDAALTVPKAQRPAKVKPEPTDNGHCPKCGRFNEVGYPNCLNAKACATRIETAQNYNTHVLGKK